MSIEHRINKLEDQFLPRPEPAAPAETLRKIEAVLIRAIAHMPGRMRLYAEKIFSFGEEKTDEEAKKLLGNIAFARQLKGRRS